MKTQKPKLYFAHPINTYNTNAEKFILEILPWYSFFKGYEIENPNQPHHQEGYQKLKEATGNGMDYFFDLVTECSGVIMLPFADGSIGAGVAGEAEKAFEKKYPVFCISVETLEIQKIENFNNLKILSVEETRQRLRDENGNLKTEFYKKLK